LAAAIHAWSHAHAMNPDGLVYLDMASEAYRDGPANLVNGLWSPAFPALLAMAFSVFQPAPGVEFHLAHGVNFLAYCLALLGFTFFLKSWLAAGREESAPAQTSYETPFGFSVFLWFTIEFIGLRVVSPDLLMEGVIFLSLGICCRMQTKVRDWRWFAALGAVLGLGYYVKAPMFPLGVVLLALLFIWPPSEYFSRRKLLLSAGVFLIVSAPLIVLISKQAGRFSLGESGRLNYAWHVNGLNQMAWTGGDGGALGTPIHPPRTVLDKPLVIEFADPVKGTYPLWYDPCYWYAGAKTRVSLTEQIQALKTNASAYWWSSQLQTILIGGALAMLALGGLRRNFTVPNRMCMILLLWTAAACGLFALVHVEFRYVAALFVPAWLALYRHLGRNAGPVLRSAVLLCVALVLTVQMASELPGLAAAAWARSRGASQPVYVQVANGLHAAGVKRGDRLATVGLALDAYYARYNGSRVVAHLLPQDTGQSLSAEDWGRVKLSLARIGVTALVARQRPAGASPEDWQDLQTTGQDRYSVMRIPAAGSAAK
jgi:4-amino-4-deoxy-L-arabinose transferase-like glycosyltransferase